MQKGREQADGVPSVARRLVGFPHLPSPGAR